MEYKNLQTFLQIVESGSFSRAAEKMGYTQSTVSFQIKQLETELDCLLFDRIGKSIQLTEGGRRLLEHAMKVSHCMHDLTESFRASGTPRGRVHMFSSDSICEKMMMLNYQEFYRKYPDIQLIFSTGDTVDLLKVLDRNEADVIFTLDSHIYQPEYIIAGESPVEMCFVTNPGHPLVKAGTVQAEDLLEYPFILTEKGMSYRKILDSFMAEKNLQIQPVLETGRTDIITGCLKEGKFIGFLPEFVFEEEIRTGKLARFQVRDFQPKIWKQLIYRRDKWISNALNAFIEFVTSHEFSW